jgi:hypothetical protein
MGGNIRIEKAVSDNSDKLDKLLAMERRVSSPTHTSSLSSGAQSVSLLLNRDTAVFQPHNIYSSRPPPQERRKNISWAN